MKLKAKRIGAYIIDYMFVILISSMICEFNVFDAYTEKYLESYEFVEKMNKEIIDNLEVDKIYSEEYSNSFNATIRYGGVATVVTTICYLLYFVGFQKWNHNQTLGKKIFGIEVISVNRENPSWLSYIIRTIIAYGLAFNIASLVLAFLLSGKMFINSIFLMSLCSYIIMYAIIFMIMFKSDGRGIHDMLSGTIVKEKVND